jgi:hypothetical protein
MCLFIYLFIIYLFINLFIYYLFICPHTPLTDPKLAANCDLKPVRCHRGSDTAPYALKLGVYIH